MLFTIKNTDKSLSTKACLQPANGLFISSTFEYLHKNLNLNFLDLDGKFVKLSSNGRFGFHELIIFLAKQISPAELIVSSFSVSLSAANLFEIQKKDGTFSEITIIINNSRKINNKKAIDKLKSFSNIYFSKVHAKVAVLKSEKYSFSIVSTGNLSTGGNIEFFVVFSDIQSINFDYEFLHSLYR